MNYSSDMKNVLMKNIKDSIPSVLSFLSVIEQIVNVSVALKL